jgi:outer membrane protein OmpA-like peptidoglycan-associated protein
VVFDELTDEEKISESTIYFAQESARINSVAKRDLKNLIAYLKENPSIKLKLTGHMDLSEFDESKVKVRLSDIGAQRAASLKNYFVSKGLEESRFTSKDKAASVPLSKHKTPMQLAKNRRVEFSVQ